MKIERLFDKVNVKNYKIKICARCGKEFKPTGSNQKYCEECILIVTRERNTKNAQKWRQANPERANETATRWRKRHPNRVKEVVKKWKERHLDKVIQWRKEHPDEIREEVKQWRKENPDKVRGYAKKQSNRRHRDLGFIPLNEYFEGSDAHHINKNEVIYIPKKYHRSICHCLETGKNMALINSIAWDYLIESKIAEKIIGR